MGLQGELLFIEAFLKAHDVKSWEHKFEVIKGRSSVPQSNDLSVILPVVTINGISSKMPIDAMIILLEKICQFFFKFPRCQMEKITTTNLIKLSGEQLSVALTLRFLK